MSAIIAVVVDAWTMLFGFLPPAVFSLFTWAVVITVFFFILRFLAYIWESLPFL